MNQTTKETSINLRYIAITLVAVLSSWLLHEYFHWLAGEMLGNNMTMTLNTSYPTSLSYKNANDATIVSAAGPLITLLQAVIFYLLIKKYSNPLLFPFLLTCLYMRLLAGVISFINLNDEARISKDLHLGAFTLPIIMIAVLFYLVYTMAKTEVYKHKFVWLTVLLIMAFSSAIVLLDQAFKIKILT